MIAPPDGEIGPTHKSAGQVAAMVGQSRRLRAVIPVLAVSLSLGAAYSHFLNGVHQRIAAGKMPSASCGGGWFDCSKTLGSSYSELFGLPVSVYAEAWFAFLLMLLLCGLSRNQDRRGLCRALFWAISPGVGITLAYLALSTLVLHVLCLYCSGLYLLVGLSAALAFLGMEVPPETKLRIQVFFRQFRQGWALPLFLFATVIYVEWMLAKPNKALTAQSTPGITPDGQGGLPQISPDQAVLHITEFVDFECPACRFSARELDRFMAKHPGEVELRCASLMLHCTQAGGNVPPGAACLAARVGAVMQRRGLFWLYYKGIMFSERKVDEALVWDVVCNILGNDQLLSVRSELANPAIQGALRINMRLAHNNKIDQTPSWIINRHLEVGTKTEEAWEELLAAARKHEISGQLSVLRQPTAKDF